MNLEENLEQEKIEFKGISWDAFFGSCFRRNRNDGKCSKTKSKCLAVDCLEWKELQPMSEERRAINFSGLSERCVYGGVVKGKEIKVCVLERVGEQIRNNSCKMEDCDVWKKLSKLLRKKVVKINE